MTRAASILLPLMLATCPALAQQSPKYWIFFADKLDAAGKTTVAEDGYVSDRALERRARRGSAVPASIDAPVSPHYMETLRALGVDPVFESRWLNAISARLDADGREAVGALPFVKEVRAVAPLSAAEWYPAPLVYPMPTPNPLNSRLDYGPSRTQLEVANAIPPLERGINGDGVVLGFIDTRFDLTSGNHFGHRALRHIADDGRVTARDFTGVDQQHYGGNQSNLHGMNVASVAAGFEEGQLIGPAYGATIFAATTEFAPHERNSEEDNFVAALEWMETEGVDAVNSSLGYTTFDAGQRSYTHADLDGDTGVTTRAVDRAAQLGVIVVTSAGNSGTGPWRLISTPADADSVISVGGVRSDRSYWPSSSQGPTADGRTKPEVSAQSSGVYFASSSGSYASGGGTSFSSPMVAGIVCQMLQVNPGLTPIEAREILKATASQKDAPDNRLGWGIVDADAAVMEAERCADPNFACVTPETVSVEEAARLADGLSVDAPFPNPFASSATFTVRSDRFVEHARLAVYDVLGRRVAVPYSGPLHAGAREITLQAGSLPAGHYVYRLEGDGRIASGKIVALR